MIPVGRIGFFDFSKQCQQHQPGAYRQQRRFQKANRPFRSLPKPAPENQFAVFGFGQKIDLLPEPFEHFVGDALVRQPVRMRPVFAEIPFFIPKRPCAAADPFGFFQNHHLPAGMRQKRRGTHSRISCSDNDRIRHNPLHPPR